MELFSSFYRIQILQLREKSCGAEIKWGVLGFPRVHASYTRRNNSKETYIHLIMPWIAFKNLKKVQVTFFDHLETLSSVCSLVLRTRLSQTSSVQSRTPLEVFHTRGQTKEPMWTRVLKLENFPQKEGRIFEQSKKRRRENLLLNFLLLVVFNYRAFLFLLQATNPVAKRKKWWSRNQLQGGSNIIHLMDRILANPLPKRKMISHPSETLILFSLQDSN